MKHIFKNNIVAITATEEDPNFPASNMLDLHPGRKYSAGLPFRTATISAGIIGGVSDIALINTNAAECSVSVYDPNVLDLDDNISIIGFSLANKVFETSSTISVNEKEKKIWISLSTITTVDREMIDGLEVIDTLTLPGAPVISPTVMVPCYADITLTCPAGQALYIGVATAAIAEDYGGAKIRYGAGGSRKDNSIEDFNPLGYRYYLKTTLPKVRQVTSRMLTEEFNVLDAYIEENGRVPSAWNLVEGSDGWVLFGYPDITEQYSYLNHVDLSMTITEVI